MRYSEIMEAPIGTMDVSDMDQPGSFSDVDRKLLSNPAHIEKIKKHFDLNTFDFDLYFINQVGVQYMEPVPTRYDDPNEKFKRPFRGTGRFYDDLEDQTGQISPQTAKAKYGIVSLNPDAITIIYLSNANEENPIPMTPWIVAHRFAHALTENQRVPPGVSSGLAKLADLKIPLIKDFQIDTPLTKLMTNRSARNGTIGAGEFREEMISQYLTTGRVTLALPGAEPKVQTGIQKLANQINIIIDKIMDSCVGHVFVSV